MVISRPLHLFIYLLLYKNIFTFILRVVAFQKSYYEIRHCSGNTSISRLKIDVTHHDIVVNVQSFPSAFCCLFISKYSQRSKYSIKFSCIANIQTNQEPLGLHSLLRYIWTHHNIATNIIITKTFGCQKYYSDLPKVLIISDNTWPSL